jgi:hypothetical protein
MIAASIVAAVVARVAALFCGLTVAAMTREIAVWIGTGRAVAIIAA